MTTDIAYQNKDIEFKLLSETFKEKSFEAYGLHLPRIKEVLPTNLPAVSANELRMDNLFLLEDDTYALVDYESEDSVQNRIKYVNYVARVTERFYKENKKIPVIRMIVIYTGDVARAESVFRMGCMTLVLDQVFVAKLPAEQIYATVKRKLENRESLAEQELMQLIILPLAERGKEGKQKRVKQVINLASHLLNEEEQKFVLSGLIVSSDKFISKEDADSIRREISMTKVGRLLFEDGLREGEERGRREGEERGRREGEERGRREGEERGRREGEERGRREGEERGIEAFILDNLEEQVSEERIIEKLQRRFRLNAEQAKKYYEKYSKVMV